jgi:hypothetical protein
MKNLDLSMNVLEQYLSGKNNFNHEGKPVQYNGGYMVSLGGYETIITMNETRPHTSTAQLLNDISEKLEILKRIKETETDELVLGLWRDNNKVYIDISRNIKDKTEALAYGKHHNQKAIYDLANDKSIFI